ncbi:MAG: DNA translocase FtsK 4TM domain-containing protein [Gammaproteobacteria bacterium]
MANHLSHGLREASMFVCGAIALYLFIALLTYTPADPGWSYSGAISAVANRGGVAGAWFADVFLHLFGYLSYLVPAMLAYSAWLVLKKRSEFEPRQFAVRMAGFILALCAGAALATLQFNDLAHQLPQSAGGILGEVISMRLVLIFSFLGATLFLLALFLAGVTLATGLSWLWLMDTLGRMMLNFIGHLRPLWLRLREYWQGRRARLQREDTVKVETKKFTSRPPPRIEPVMKTLEVRERVEKERQVPLFEHPASLPPLALLDPAVPVKQSISEAALEAMSRQVEFKLKDFGIEVQVVAVHPGPVITRFELQPTPGMKVSQITNLVKDLARSLSVISVRVVEVIPGKSVIGLEIPNEHRSIVRLSETLQSKAYDSTSSPLTLALGKDISGQPVLVDLARMPHLLVAGTTGSGKSVGINAMILSLLYNASPNDVRMIMIDPKMLELSVYEGIPHLLTPVVTDMKEAANALRWCVAEMDKRYRLMATLGVRNITGYNQRIKDAEKTGGLPDPFAKPGANLVEGAQTPRLQHLPYIVVLVDEFADMMMVVGKKVEDLIARLAQKARASGIHLILATQRPSVDVITGLIKANIPTRIAFQVSSKIDSRTILDQMGAEQLLGHGDMLYLPPGTAVPIRIHGAFVADHEVHKVVDHLKRRGEPDYLEEILTGGSEEPGNYPGEEASNAEADPLYDQALFIVTETRRASISGIQRRLKIGYNRAARLVEDMERSGVVGPLQSNGSREVLAPPPAKA